MDNERFWVVCHEDGTTNIVPEKREGTSVLNQLYELIGGEEKPCIDITPLTCWIMGPVPLYGVVSDNGLLLPEIYPMNRKLMGLAGPVVIGQNIQIWMEADGYNEQDIGGLSREDAESVKRTLDLSVTFPSELAEAQREERLRAGGITDLETGEFTPFYPDEDKE